MILTKVGSMRAKTREKFVAFKGYAPYFVPAGVVLSATIALVWLNALWLNEIISLLSIVIYSVATTVYICVLFNPEQYRVEVNSGNTESSTRAAYRHILFALPALAIIVPAAFMYYHDLINSYDITALMFITLTNIGLVIEKIKRP